MNEASVVEAKRTLRTDVRARRSLRSPEERADAQRGFNSQIGSLVATSGATTIAAFVPLPTEPPIAHILEKISLVGIQVLLPKARPDRTMDWAVHQPGSDFTTDELGMPAPHGELVDAQTLASIQLILCPAALVDTEGFRLGWGLGYYDRFLATLEHKPPVLAVVFDDEVVDAVPREAHDHPVNGAITPTRVIWF